MTKNLNKNDLDLLSSIGISRPEIDSQVEFINSNKKEKIFTLSRPCLTNDGILSSDEINNMGPIDDMDMDSISRFIPASGSSTRMFDFNNVNDTFFNDIKFLPLFSLVSSYCKIKDVDLSQILIEKDLEQLKDILLSEKKMNLGNFPKAMLPFHLLNDIVVTPMEEIIFYSLGDIINSSLFFTVQKADEEAILKTLKNSILLKDINFEDFVKFSYQDSSTNSLCFDTNNDIVRNDNGDIHTHPSGHGALLSNLNQVGSDYVFINNIDNISPKTRLLRYEISKILYNVAANTKKKFDMILKTFIERNYALLRPSIDSIIGSMPGKIKEETIEKKVDIIIDMLNKPIRVCGVVKDEDSKGGKPFWVFDGNSESVQIVEEFQVNMKDRNQKAIWKSGVYFNPVEMICSLKDFRGIKFNLFEFAENSLKMKVEKNIFGKKSTFIERPGLWNGCMHYWHTTFVEIPKACFTPVKNFGDLFLPIHRT